MACFRFLLPDKEMWSQEVDHQSSRSSKYDFHGWSQRIDGWQLPHHAQSVGGSGFANASRSRLSPDWKPELAEEVHAQTPADVE